MNQARVHTLQKSYPEVWSVVQKIHTFFGADHPD
jgi:hypothetical protein